MSRARSTNSMNKLNKKKTSRQARPCTRAKSKISCKNKREPSVQQKSNNKVAPESTIAVPGTPIDVAEARKKIDSLVRASSDKIVNALIEAAGKGKLAEAKYLFEIIGLHPATHEAAFRPENSLAYRLLKRLGLPTEPVEREGEQFSQGEARVEEQGFLRDSAPPQSDATVERMP
jgi:hypothetical protein